MNGREEEFVDEPLGRPFLTHTHGGSAILAAVEDHGTVRPYLLTGGRTTARHGGAALETVVQATGEVPPYSGDAAGLERERILRLAERPCSAAEVAARLHLPLQVTLVLVNDLVEDGLLDAMDVAVDQAGDILFLERLIAGVAAL